MTTRYSTRLYWDDLQDIGDRCTVSSFILILEYNLHKVKSIPFRCTILWTVTNLHGHSHYLRIQNISITQEVSSGPSIISLSQPTSLVTAELILSLQFYLFFFFWTSYKWKNMSTFEYGFLYLVQMLIHVIGQVNICSFWVWSSIPLYECTWICILTS